MHIDALIHTFRPLDIIDILVVAVGIYYLYKMLKDTRAVALLKGIVFLAIINLISHLFNLYVINWILQQSMTVLLFVYILSFAENTTATELLKSTAQFRLEHDW